MTPTDKAARREGLGWAIWGIGAAFYGYAFFQRVAPSVMVADLMRDLGLDGTGLGALSAAYFYAYAAVQVPAGLLLDRLGPRRLLSSAAVLAAAGGFLFAAAESVWLATLGRVAIGAGVGVAYVGSLKIAAAWLPPSRFGLVAGLTLTVGAVGAMSAQIPLAFLIAATDWRFAMALVAALGLAIALLAGLGIREPGDDPAARARPAGGVGASLGAILRRRETWLLAGVTAFLGGPILAFAGLWGVPYFEQVAGMPRSRAGLFTSILLAAWAVGGPLAGALSDRLGRRPVIVGCALLMAAAWLPFLLVLRPPPALVTVAVLAMGLGGGAMVVAYAAARDRFESEGAATAMGIVNTSVLICGALLQILVGWLLDLGWEGASAGGARLYPAEAWRSAWLVLFAAPLTGALCAWLLPRRGKTGILVRGRTAGR